MSNCAHLRWQYCRRVFSNGSQHFGCQCMDCLSIIKIERHAGKLWLKPDDIPENSPIHAWIDPDVATDKRGLLNE